MEVCVVGGGGVLVAVGGFVWVAVGGKGLGVGEGSWAWATRGSGGKMNVIKTGWVTRLMPKAKMIPKARLTTSRLKKCLLIIRFDGNHIPGRSVFAK